MLDVGPMRFEKPPAICAPTSASSAGLGPCGAPHGTCVAEFVQGRGRASPSVASPCGDQNLSKGLPDGNYIAKRTAPIAWSMNHRDHSASAAGARQIAAAGARGAVFVESGTRRFAETWFSRISKPSRVSRRGPSGFLASEIINPVAESRGDQDRIRSSERKPPWAQGRPVRPRSGIEPLHRKEDIAGRAPLLWAPRSDLGPAELVPGASIMAWRDEAGRPGGFSGPFALRTGRPGALPSDGSCALDMRFARGCGPAGKRRSSSAGTPHRTSAKGQWLGGRSR